MPSVTDVVSALQNGVTAISNLTRTISQVFPGATAVSTTTPSSVGAITFTSSQTKGFITVLTSSGFSGKIALY